MIQVSNLSKHFNGNVAVDSVSLDVKHGEIFGLLGPNAAGKTTLIRMLCGVLTSDAGHIEIENLRPAKAKSKFGYVAQHFGQYEELSTWENLKFYAQLYGVNDQQHLLGLLHRYALTPYKDQMAGTLSGGFQRRLALACALAHDPSILFLDEPTAGIDPVTRKLLWDDFYQLSAQGKTLFITTHYMEEAQRCNRLAFMASGRIIATGSPDSIKEALGDAKVYSAQLPYSPELHRLLISNSNVLLVNQFGNELRIVVTPDFDINLLQPRLVELGNGSLVFTSSEPNLEDVFIALTQEPLPAGTESP